MPFVTDGRTLIQKAYAERFAMPSFNVASLEMARACIDAAEAERAPIMLQTYPGDLTHASPRVYAAMIRALAEEASVPIMLHLDHGDGLERAVACLRAGYSSVMFDGAELPLDENVARSKEIARIAHAANASFEAAAGSFGGGEGDEVDEDDIMTEPDVAVRMVRDADADMVAVAVGSRHGHSSRLDLDLLEELSRAVDGPIVLHGGTGIHPDDVARATELGIVKVNIGMGVVRSTLAAWRDTVPDATMHDPVQQAVRANVTAVAREKIRIMRASGHAG